MTDLPDMKIKAVPVFPSNAEGGTGIDVVRDAGEYTIDLAYSDFTPPASGIVDPASQTVLLWNSVTEAYTLTPIALFGGGGGITDAPVDGTLYGRKNAAWEAVPGSSGFAPINSPVFTGNPAAPTPAPGDNDTSIATTAFVTAAVVASGSVAPSNAAPAMDGVAAAGVSALYSRGDHVHPSDTSKAAAAHTHAQADITNLISDLALKAPLASPAFTGNPTAPTPTAGDNDTSLATTGFVQSAATSLFASVNVQKFTSSGTYTPSAKMLYAEIICLGGGGGGGAVTGVTGGWCSGGGGGAASISRKIVTKAAVGASQTVTIGAAGNGGAAGNNSGIAGGDSSVGTLCIGKGGAGGVHGNGLTSGYGTAGVGGAAGTGDITSNGAPGGQGGIATGVLTIAAIGAMGGSSALGGGGSQSIIASTGASVGNAGVGFGAGGGGAFVFDSTLTRAGGNGSPGVVAVIEYLGA